MSFESEWTGFYGRHPPISWKLREMEELHWQRFHSLPGSKRYAEDDAETSTILARHNALADAVLGDGAECWLVQAVYVSANSIEDLSRYSALPSLSLTALAMGPLYPDEPDDDDPEAAWRVFAGAVTWRRGAFDVLLTSIANDVERALWMSRATGAVFAPYDGGVDLFLPTEEQKTVLRDRFVDWLSVLPSGL